MTTTVRTWLDFAQLQSAAECYLHAIDLRSKDQVEAKLKEGANNALLQGKSPNDALLSGATRFTDAQAEWLTTNYEIVTHYPNDATGFSATLFKRIKDDPITGAKAGEYTLSFRSTEYQLQAKGGDYERDGSDATDGDISGKGYALAQLSSMETFYAHLKQGQTWNDTTKQWENNAAVAAFVGGTPALNVTGYSLGAHLSTSFTLLHEADVAATWNFNAAGIGGIVTAEYDNAIPTGTVIKSLIEFYDTLMHYDGHVPNNPLWTELVTTSPFFGDFINTASSVQGQIFANVYDNPLHDVVMNILSKKMYPAGAGNNLIPGDSMGDSILGDALLNWKLNDLNSFTSDKYQIQSASGAWSKIHQFNGHGEFMDMEFVANSGWHAAPSDIFIEDLPMSRGFGLLELLATSLRDLVGEFGETHSVVPLTDSLTVLDMIQRMDDSFDMPNFTLLERAIANSEFQFSNSSILSTLYAPNLALLGLILPEGVMNALQSDKIHDADALENIVNALHKLLLGTDPGLKPNTDPAAIAESYGNLEERNKLHKAVAEINTAVQALKDAGTQLQFRQLVSVNYTDYLAKAKQDDAEGLAYRYALSVLNPFVLVGDSGLYDTHNAVGQLNLIDTVTGEGALTETYLADRAKMLGWKMKYDIGALDADDSTRGNKPYSEDWDSWSITDDWEFVDYGTQIDGQPLRLTIDGNDPLTQTANHQIAFGSAVGETLTGSDLTDHLYGAAGSDTLNGDNGADHLEGNQGDDFLYGGFGNDTLLGGAGYDTYRLFANEGLDTLLDADGQGKVMLGALEAQGKAGVSDSKDWLQLAPGAWQDKQHGIAYTLLAQADGTRDLYIASNGGSARIKGWQNGQLGITLDAGDPAPTPEIALTLVGDLAPIDTNPAAPGIQEGYDLLGNARVGTAAAPDRADTLYDSDGNDLLQGLGGNDTLLATRGGNDRLEGGEGDDRLEGGEGLDWLEGGAGKDILLGGSGDDHLLGDAGNDYLDGGSGHDLLFGNAGSDTLDGGDEDDWMAGGAGDDMLLGGAGNDTLYGGNDKDVLQGGLGDEVFRLGRTGGIGKGRAYNFRQIVRMKRAA